MMDLEPVLQFIINRLMRGDSGDLTILSRLVQRMYGVDTVENNGVSDAQLEAYGTGREMVHEAFWATRILLARPSDDPTSKPKEAPVDKAKSTKKSLPRLINALRDTHLALPIWIALAQTRQGVVDKLAWAPLKAMGLMQDKASQITDYKKKRGLTCRFTTSSYSSATSLANSSLLTSSSPSHLTFLHFVPTSV